MIELSDKDRREVLGEVLLDELKIIREYLETVSKDTPVIKQKIIDLEDDMFEVKNDLKAIKAVIKDHSRELQNHERRITRLERKDKTKVI